MSAIVNAANEDMQHLGGVAKAIVDAAGNNGVVQRESAEWIRRHGRLKPGQMAAMTSAGNLPCKHVIHVVGPKKAADAHVLRSAVLSALRKAEENRCESVALPAISSGIFGFPLQLCAQILVQCGVEFASKRPRSVKRIVFCNIDTPTATAFKRALEAEKQGSGAQGSGGAATASCGCVIM